MRLSTSGVLSAPEGLALPPNTGESRPPSPATNGTPAASTFRASLAKASSSASAAGSDDLAMLSTARAIFVLSEVPRSFAVCCRSCAHAAVVIRQAKHVTMNESSERVFMLFVGVVVQSPAVAVSPLNLPSVQLPHTHGKVQSATFLALSGTKGLQGMARI